MPSDLVPLPRRRTEAPLKVVVELSHADVEVLIRELNLRTHQPGCYGGALTLATLVQQAFTTGMQYFRHREETREWLRQARADHAGDYPHDEHNNRDAAAPHEALESVTDDSNDDQFGVLRAAASGQP